MSEASGDQVQVHACNANEELPVNQGDVGNIIREGKAEILPNYHQKNKDGKDEVFYNPAQVFNRDLSVLVLSVFAKTRAAELEEKYKKREQRAQETGKPARDAPPPGLKILEALAATGIRSIRYVKELEAIRQIVANDLDSTAVEHIQQNLVHNHVPDGLIEVTCEDASSHMYAHRARGAGGKGDEAYDVIDVDPYGTASPFLDAAVQAVADGGLLCITSTDMPVLGGNHPETCFARYGGSALKSSYIHEMSLRLLLHAVATSAARYGREARPLVCCSIDFYVRIFVRIFDSAARAKRHASKTGMVHQCVQCESFFVQRFGDVVDEPKENTKFTLSRVVTPGPECPECGGRIKIGGPMHTGPLYDPEFVGLCLEACSEDHNQLPGVTSWKKITGLLTAISEEHRDLVLYYRLPQLCKGLKLIPVPLRQFRGTLNALGYRVSHFHREPEAIKTDAPNAVVYDLMRLWAEENPPKSTLPQGDIILKKALTLKRPIEWRTEEQAPKSKVPRFLPNPEPNWGPKARAHSGGAAAPAAAVAPVAAGDTNTCASDVALGGGEPDLTAAPEEPTIVGTTVEGGSNGVQAATTAQCSESGFASPCASAHDSTTVTN